MPVILAVMFQTDRKCGFQYFLPNFCSGIGTFLEFQRASFHFDGNIRAHTHNRRRRRIVEENAEVF